MLAAMPDRFVLVLMGVSGSGKTTIGRLLAARLGWQYAEADDFHSAANVAKMAAGRPLTDDDRWPWLQSIAAWIDARIAKREPAVVTCSALKRKYRDLLRRPEVQIVFLDGSFDEIAKRVAERRDHYFKVDLLASQFADLEVPSADEHAIIVPFGGDPSEVVEGIIAAAI